VATYIRPLPLAATIFMSLTGPTTFALIVFATVWGRLRKPYGMRWMDVLVLWVWVGAGAAGQMFAGAPSNYFLPFTLFTLLWAYTLVFAAHTRKQAHIAPLVLQYDPISEIPTYPKSLGFRMLLVSSVPLVGPPVAGATLVLRSLCSRQRSCTVASLGLLVIAATVLYVVPYMNMLVVLPLPVLCLLLGMAIDPRRYRDPARPRPTPAMTMPAIVDWQKQAAPAIAPSGGGGGFVPAADGSSEAGGGLTAAAAPDAYDRPLTFT
jgi:hypothetical protein